MAVSKCHQRLRNIECIQTNLIEQGLYMLVQSSPQPFLSSPNTLQCLLPILHKALQTIKVSQACGRHIRLSLITMPTMLHIVFVKQNLYFLRVKQTSLIACPGCRHAPSLHGAQLFLMHMDALLKDASSIPADFNTGHSYRILENFSFTMSFMKKILVK